MGAFVTRWRWRGEGERERRVHRWCRVADIPCYPKRGAVIPQDLPHGTACCKTRGGGPVLGLTRGEGINHITSPRLASTGEFAIKFEIGLDPRVDGSAARFVRTSRFFTQRFLHKIPQWKRSFYSRDLLIRFSCFVLDFLFTLVKHDQLPFCLSGSWSMRDLDDDENPKRTVEKVTMEI